MNKKYKNKSGFTLPELLVSITVMVLVIFSATDLVVSIIRSNTENINTLIAYGLAQEGLEGVRNIRDSNWLLGADFSGQVGRNKTPVWGEVIDDSGTEIFYTIDLDQLTIATIDVDNVDGLKKPWKLSRINDSEIGKNKTQIKKFIENVRSGKFRYGHDASFQEVEETPFYRYVSIKAIPTEDGGFNKMRVASVVTWKEGLRDKEVRLDTVLTDWNQG